MQKPYRSITVLLGLAVIVPLLLVTQSMWDGDLVSLYYYSGDTSYLEEIWQHGWYIAYGMYLGLGKVYQSTGIYPRLFFSLLAAASLLGMARESFVYFRQQFGLSREAGLFGALAVLAFPLWHLLAASCIAINLMLLWAFMAAVNLRRKRPVFAVVLLLFSLNFYSLFSLAIGILAVDYLMTVTRKNVVRLTRNGVLLAGGLMAYYILLTRLVNVHGEGENYNVLDPSLMAVSLGALAVGYAVVLLGRWLWVKYAHSSRDADRASRLVLSVVTLYFFAIFAYITVGREITYFHFGSFGDRHAMLTCLPLAAMLGLFADKLLRRSSRRAFHVFAGVILTAFMFLLYQGYDHKAAALLFKDMLVHSLNEIAPPPSGYVSVAEDGYRAPRHVHAYSVQVCFYRAYGKWAWLPNGFWGRRGHEYSRADLEKRYPLNTRSGVFAGDAVGDAFSKYRFLLRGYHQEGRIWYWYNLVFRQYDHFDPRLERVE